MKRSRATMDNNLKIVGPAMSDLPWKIVLPARSVILPLLPRLPHLRGLLPATQASCRFP